MPLVSSLYVPPFPFQNGRLNTVFPTLFRRVDYPDRQEGGDSLLRRERISTPDAQVCARQGQGLQKSRGAVRCLEPPGRLR